MQYRIALAAGAVALGLAAGAPAGTMQLEGTIRDVDRRAETITVELEESDRTVTYAVADDTDITVYGNIGRDMDNLEPGQHVELDFDDSVTNDAGAAILKVLVIS